MKVTKLKTTRITKGRGSENISGIMSVGAVVVAGMIETKTMIVIN